MWSSVHIFLSFFVLLVILVFAGFIYQQRSQRILQQEVTQIFHEYFPLSGDEQLDDKTKALIV